MAAVVGGGWGAERDVDDAQLVVGAQAAPRAHVSRQFTGSVAPGVRAEFSLPGDDVEGPRKLARAGIVAADVLGLAVAPLRARVPGAVDRARDDDDVADDDGSRTPAEAVAAFGHEVHVAAIAERRHGLPGPGVERVQPGSAHGDDAPAGVAVVGGEVLGTVAAPVGDAAEAASARVFQRSGLLDPAGFAGPGIEGLHKTHRIGREQRPVHEDRGPAQVVVEREFGEHLLQARIDAGALPCDFERRDVLRADLRERGVPVEGVLAAVVGPLGAGWRIAVGILSGTVIPSEIGVRARRSQDRGRRDEAGCERHPVAVQVCSRALRSTRAHGGLRIRCADFRLPG